MRLLLGLCVFAAGVGVFVVERLVRPASWAEGGGFGLLFDIHDLRFAALIAASCGLALALSAIPVRDRDPSWPQFDDCWPAVGASLLAAATLPVFGFMRPEDRSWAVSAIPPPPPVPPDYRGEIVGDSFAIAGFDPVATAHAYDLLLRTVQVVLVVATIGAAIAAARADRRRAVLGIGVGVGVGYAVLTAAGALDVRVELPFLGSYPALTAVPAATALLILWRGRSPRLGWVRYGAAAVMLVGMPVIYLSTLPLGLALSHATWTKPESTMVDGMPIIGFGPAAAVGLLLLHLFARPAREDVDVPDVAPWLRPRA